MSNINKHKNVGLKHIGLASLVSLVVVVFDQLTKAWALNSLSFTHAVPVIPGLFDFQLVLNGGAAFGMGQGKTAFFLCVCLAVCILACYFLYTTPNLTTTLVVLFGCVVGGGIGNAIDRATTGLVVDFIKFVPITFPVFNVADIAISVGICLIVIIVLVKDRKESDDSENSRDTNRS